MYHHMIGPFWGNVIVIAIGSIITLACFAAMFWMLIRPGERNPEHPKHKILSGDL